MSSFGDIVWTSFINSRLLIIVEAHWGLDAYPNAATTSRDKKQTTGCCHSYTLTSEHGLKNKGVGWPWLVTFIHIKCMFTCGITFLTIDTFKLIVMEGTSFFITRGQVYIASIGSISIARRSVSLVTIPLLPFRKISIVRIWMLWIYQQSMTIDHLKNFCLDKEMCGRQQHSVSYFGVIHDTHTRTWTCMYVSRLPCSWKLNVTLKTVTGQNIISR